MKILATAKQRGSVNVLMPVVAELQARGHEVRAYATGNETEAAGFGERIQPKEYDYPELVKGYDAVITGLSGYVTPDGRFMRAAVSAGIPVIGVQDQDKGYAERFGYNPSELPDLIAVMDEGCISTMRKEMEADMGYEAVKRARVVGWTAFDKFADMRSRFTGKDRLDLLAKLGISPDAPLYTHFTQNINPEAKYVTDRNLQEQWLREKTYEYEIKVTQRLFGAAADLGLRLAVKPHPGEEDEADGTKPLAKRFNFVYLPADACDSRQLMLASHSVTAGRSTCLTESCLLDRNTGGILPGMGQDWIDPFPPLRLTAIPYTQRWDDIERILELVASHNASINQILSNARKKFSVDGKASKRLADLVESLG